jgi:hypothetical protein
MEFRGAWAIDQKYGRQFKATEAIEKEPATTTLVIAGLLETMNKTVLLAAPTGRASQRMSEVIGREAKTIHRLLEWQGGEFQMNEASKLKTDFLIVDECSMLDISLTASLLILLCQITCLRLQRENLSAISKTTLPNSERNISAIRNLSSIITHPIMKAFSKCR